MRIAIGRTDLEDLKASQDGNTSCQGRDVLFQEGPYYEIDSAEEDVFREPISWSSMQRTMANAAALVECLCDKGYRGEELLNPNDRTNAKNPKICIGLTPLSSEVAPPVA
jgi:hypothetical protein